MPRKRPTVTSPNMGLYLDRPWIDIPERALRDGKNFRCKNGSLESLNLGWERFSYNWTLDGPVKLIDNFFPRNLDEQLILGTDKSLYRHDPDTDQIYYLNPRYETGTASAAGTAVTGTGTNWDPDINPGDFIYFGTAGATAGNPGNDEFTHVLLHMNGADGSTTFLDTNLGGSAHTWTANGNAQIDTAESQFGGASGLFDGTGDYVTTPDHADFTLGSGDFTIDLWFNVGAGSTDGVSMFMAGQANSTISPSGSTWSLDRNQSGNRLRFLLSNAGTNVSLFSTSTFTNSVNTGWNHVAIVRRGDSIEMFINGVSEATNAFTGAVNDTANPLVIGAGGSFPTNRWIGWLDEFRLSVGIARYGGGFTPTSTQFEGWYPITAVADDTSLTIGIDVGAVPDGPYTIRRSFVMSPDDNWAFDTFVNDGDTGDDLWFATNGIESVMTWDGVATQVTLHPELGFTCRTLSTFSNMMVYGNITQSGNFLPSTIINSDIGLPLHAGATGTGLSEQFVTHSGTDEILNLVPLGDYLVVYCERTLVPIQFVGDPLIFLFRVAISGVGPISSNAIADFGDFHEFIGADAGYLFDGVTLKEVNSHVWRDILRQTDPARRRQAFGHFDEEQGDLIWSIPNNIDPDVGVVGGSATLAWGEHYLEDPGENIDGSPFSKRDFPFTISGFYERSEGLSWSDITETWEEFNFAWNDQFFQTAFPLNLVGDVNGLVWVLNQTQTGNGEPLPSFVRFGRRALRTGRERDLLTRIYPFARRLPFMLQVKLFMGDNIGGDIQDKGVLDFDMTLPEGGHFVSFFRRGRVFEIQFGSDAGEPWVIDGWAYDSVDGGER